MSARPNMPSLSSVAPGGVRAFGAPRPTVDWRARIERARIHLRAGTLAGAVQALEPVIGSVPSTEEDASVLTIALAVAGRVLVDLGRDRDGMPLLRRAVEAFERSSVPPIGDPEDAADISAALRYLGRSDEAVALLEASIASETSVPWRVHLELGRVLHLTGRVPEAIAALTTALEDKPGEPFVLRERAACFERTGDSQAALTDLTDAALAFFGRERTEEGIEAITHAVDIAPDDPQTIAQAAYALQSAGEQDQAWALVDRLAGAPLPLFAQYLQALVLWQQRRLREAATAIDAVLEQVPTHVEAVAAAVDVHLALDEFHRARAIVDQALAVEPDDAGLRRVRGALLRNRGEWTAALEDFGAVIEQDPTDTQALSGAAACDLKLGRPEQALERLRHALTLAPDDIGVRNEYAETLRTIGEDDDALRELGTVLAADPDNAYALGTRGQILLTRPSQRPAGIKDLRAAAARAPGLSWVIGELTRALAEDGHVADALEVAAAHVADAGIVLPLARMLHQRRWVDEAVDLLRRAHAVNPTPQVSVEFIDRLYEIDRFAEVVDAATGVLDELPASTRVVVAESLRVLGRLDEARSLVDQVLAEEPAAVGALLVRSRIASADDDPAAAERYVRDALAHAPDEPVVHARLGRLLRNRAAYAEAVEWLGRAYASEKTKSETAAEYAECLLMLGRAEDALAPAEEGARSGFDAVFAAGILAAVLRALKRPDGALRVIERAGRAAADNHLPAWIVHEQVRSLIDVERLDEAVRVAETLAAESGDDDPESHAILASVLFLIDRVTDGIHALDRALTLGENRALREYRCILLLNVGRYREVVDILGPMIADGDPVDPYTPAVLARALMRLQPPMPNEALRVLDRSGDTTAGTASALRLLLRAEVLFVVGDRVDAEACCRDVLAVVGRMPVPASEDLSIQGWAELRLGYVNRAARSLTRSLELRADPDSQFSLGLIMLHANDHARAAFEYRRGLALADALPDPERRWCVLNEALVDLNEATDLFATLSDKDDQVRELKTMLRTQAALVPLAGWDADAR